MTETLTGGCLCGAVRYRAEASETVHYLCHCTDCQKHSGGAGHAAIVVAASEVTVTGPMKHWLGTADSGRTIARYFCDTCAGHICTSPWPEVTRYSLKAGTLDDGAAFQPSVEIWAQSRPDWTARTGLTTYDQGFTSPVTIGSKG